MRKGSIYGLSPGATRLGLGFDNCLSSSKANLVSPDRIARLHLVLIVSCLGGFIAIRVLISYLINVMLR
jgi:hypothetical protein